MGHGQSFRARAAAPPPLALALLAALLLSRTQNPRTSASPTCYPCKPNLLVTAADFHSDALAKPGQLVAPFDTSFAGATVKQFPGVNGLDLAATRLDVRVGGVMPLHAHPEASQLLIVAKGALSASFISAGTNKVETAVAFSAYSSSNPGLQIADYALFGNTLPADVVEKVTFIKEAEVKRLKAFFGPRAVPS
ncbi:unnamed protein product [Urochloa decumbens]|uniref:Cupin type-1 domain-containing protein n=1 Tax=Urochloa decumbens TaxID=240449 RepID=A0ABC9BQ67_9POAL